MPSKSVRGCVGAALLLASVLVQPGLRGAALAAEAPDFSIADSATAKPAQSQSQNQWNVACASEGRSEPLRCAIEQVAVVAETRQRFGAISVHTTSAGNEVTLQVLTPLGLLVPAGVSIRPDDGKPIALAIRSCDNSGCHAEMPIGPDLLRSLQTGKRLTLSLQSLSNKTMSVDFDLMGFTAAYARIK